LVRILRLLLLVFASVIIFTSCNQDPTSVGSTIVPIKDQIGFAQVDSYLGNFKQSSSFYSTKPLLGGAYYLLLGNLPYMQSSIIFRWDIYLDDSLKTAIQDGSLTVKSAYLTMTQGYIIGDSTSKLDFTISQIRSSWSAAGFDRDSVSQLVVDNTNIKTGTISITQSTKNVDSLYTCNLNPSAVYNWLKYVADSSSVQRSYGTQLVPTSSTKKIIGFKAIDLLTSGTSSATLLHVVLSRPNWYTDDTLVVSPSQDIHYIQKYVPPANNGDIYLEGSYATSGKVFIDFPSIPKNVIINKAILTLYVDSLNTTDGSLKSDSIAIKTLGDSTSNVLTKDSTIYGLLIKSGNTFSGNIAWMIQKWIDKDTNYPNQGATLSLTDQTESAARIAFYGSKNPNKLLRPKLTFTYMQKQ
jgi:hypothetical protein